jgi:hypothetical protein
MLQDSDLCTVYLTYMCSKILVAVAFTFQLAAGCSSHIVSGRQGTLV